MALAVALGFLTLLTTYLAQQSVNVTHCCAAESLDSDVTSSLKTSSARHSSPLIWCCDSGAKHRCTQASSPYTLCPWIFQCCVFALPGKRNVHRLLSPLFGAFLFSCSISFNSLTVLSRRRIRKHLTYSRLKKKRKKKKWKLFTNLP